MLRRRKECPQPVFSPVQSVPVSLGLAMAGAVGPTLAAGTARAPPDPTHRGVLAMAAVAKLLPGPACSCSRIKKGHACSTLSYELLTHHRSA